MSDTFSMYPKVMADTRSVDFFFYNYYSFPQTSLSIIIIVGHMMPDLISVITIYIISFCKENNIYAMQKKL